MFLEQAWFWPENSEFRFAFSPIFGKNVVWKKSDFEISWSDFLLGSTAVVFFGQNSGILGKYSGILGKNGGILAKYSGMLGKYSGIWGKYIRILRKYSGILPFGGIFGKYGWILYNYCCILSKYRVKKIYID